MVLAIIWNTDNQCVMPSSCLTDCPTFISSSAQPADVQWTYKRTIVPMPELSLSVSSFKSTTIRVGPGTKGLTSL